MAVRPQVLVAVDGSETLSTVVAVCLPCCELADVVYDGWAMLECATNRLPDLIIADLDMRGLDGIEATARLHRLGRRVPVIILAEERAPELVKEAFAAGALAYVVKRDAAAELTFAVRAVLGGRQFSSHSCG